MEAGPSLWLILLTVGAAALCAALVYGVIRTRNRSRVEKAITDAATREEYRREDKDAS
jgi:hypothetical protein